METIKKNITLVLGISIPILMILFVAGSIYLPGLFIKPQFNFLYVSNDNPYYNDSGEYSVQNGKLIKNEVKQFENKNDNSSRDESRLYLHDVTKNESREVSFEEIRSLDLDSSAMSPDDFEIVYGNRDGGIFFLFGSPGIDYSTKYLKGHRASKKLNLQPSENPHYYNFRFLGWIK